MELYKNKLRKFIDEKYNKNLKFKNKFPTQKLIKN